MTQLRSYAEDPTLADGVFDLLDTVFPGAGIPVARRGAQLFGAPWELASTPFVHQRRGRIVSHVGLLNLPLTIGGRPVVAGGVHGVATHPEYRRRGLFRSLIEELLDVEASRFETLVLTTAHPEYFEPFGFRVVQEHRFRLSVTREREPVDARVLDLGRPDDRALVHRLLEERAPLSDRLSLGREKCVWAFYEAFSQLLYLPSSDALVIGELVGSALHLFDVVAPTIPRLECLLGAWPDTPPEVVAFFTADRLDPEFEATPHDPADGDGTWLMIRGALPGEGLPVMLGRGARC